MAPHAPRLLAAGVLALCAAQTIADDSNSRPYVVGSRAAGMGGAFTALADDGSGPFYNPGGVAFVRRSQLALSGSVYGFVSGTFQDALMNGHDFTYRNLNVFPTATAAVWKLQPPEATHADVLALTVYVPDAFSADDRDKLGSAENAFFFVNQVQTIWAGATYARRMGRIGIGASAFLLLGSRLTQLDLSVVAAGDASRFGTLTGRTDESIYGVVGAVGVRWDVTDNLHLGAAVYSPAIGGGSRRTFARQALGAGVATAGAPSSVEVVNRDDLHASPTEPLRVQLGAAWTSGRWTLTGDVTVLGAREVVDDPGPLERRVVRNAVVNGAAGLEYVIADRFPVAVGFFTDFAASRNPPDASTENTSHVDRFGGTASIGLRSEHTSTRLGVNVSGGTGHDLVPNNLDFAQLKVSGSSQLLVYVFLGTAYEF